MSFFKTHLKKLIILLVLLILTAGGFLFYSMKHKNSVPEVVVEPNITFKDMADEEIEFDDKKEPRDLTKSVLIREHLYKIQERSYPLATPPGKKLRYARALFYIQVKKEKDLDVVEFNEPLILETINTVMRSTRPEDCEGFEGKEVLRLKLVHTLNQKLPVPLVSLRFGSFTVL